MTYMVMIMGDCYHVFTNRYAWEKCKRVKFADALSVPVETMTQESVNAAMLSGVRFVDEDGLAHVTDLGENLVNI